MKIKINNREFDAQEGDEFLVDNGDECACGCGGTSGTIDQWRAGRLITSYSVEE